MLNGRVCDRCIRKKVKCDLQRPQCSRCSEGGFSCVYSTERKKPGPPRGARRNKTLTPPSEAMSITVIPATTTQLPSPQLHPATNGGSRDSIVAFNAADFSNASSPFGVALSMDHSRFPGYTLDTFEERSLLATYFDEINPSFPLFHKDRFMDQYNAGIISSELIVAMVAVTARILVPVPSWPPHSVDMCLASLLASTTSDDFNLSRGNLCRYKLECIMAFYEFNQFPGTTSWMRVSRLTRKAYALGLNQIENPHLCSAYDARMATEHEIEDWRYAWWCVFALDSYVNAASGACTNVDIESINTALVRRPWDDSDPEFCFHALPKLFLAEDLDNVWRTTQEVLTQGTTSGFNINMIMATVVRDVGTLVRLRTEKGPERLMLRTARLKNDLASLKLSLPPRYLFVQRNASRAETDVEYSQRLLNVLLYHAVRMAVDMPTGLTVGGEEWMRDWESLHETCREIALLVSHWSQHSSPKINPIVTIVPFTALMVLNLSQRSDPDTSVIPGGLSQLESTLLLFLEDSGKGWYLPRHMAGLFRDHHANSPSYLTLTQADSILNRLPCPLHPKFPTRNWSPAEHLDTTYSTMDPAITMNFGEQETLPITTLTQYSY
ncbi:NAD(P)-binding protein [Apiospora arundinis]